MVVPKDFDSVVSMAYVEVEYWVEWLGELLADLRVHRKEVELVEQLDDSMAATKEKMLEVGGWVDFLEIN